MFGAIQENSRGKRTPLALTLFVAVGFVSLLSLLVVNAFSSTDYQRGQALLKEGKTCEASHVFADLVRKNGRGSQISLTALMNIKDECAVEACIACLDVADGAYITTEERSALWEHVRRSLPESGVPVDFDAASPARARYDFQRRLRQWLGDNRSNLIWRDGRFTRKG